MTNFQKSGQHNILLTTQVAQVAVTFSNLDIVIDCGLTQMDVYDSKTGLSEQVIVPESQAEAYQRATRAGRVKPGVCYQLFPQDYQLPQQQVPEIQRIDLSHALIKIKGLGLSLNLQWMDEPKEINLARGFETLYGLGLITETGYLSVPFGLYSIELPLEPHLSTILLNAQNFNCVKEVLSLVSILSLRKHIKNPAKLKVASREGDLITILNLFIEFKKQKRDQE